LVRGGQLLAGSLIGALIGANWATRMRSATLYRVLAVLLVLIAVALAWNHFGDLNPRFGQALAPRLTINVPALLAVAARGV
jgi:glucose uptake protein GlcU